jgi:hypothetical protein
MKNRSLESVLAETRECRLYRWATTEGRKAIVSGGMVATLALAGGCAFEPVDGSYYDAPGFYGENLVDGGFYDGFRPGFREGRHDGEFRAAREGGHEGGEHEGGHEGGHEAGGHEGGGHEGGGGHGGGGHR